MATPLVTQEALFGQAGVIAVASLGELTEAAALLAGQPLPAGCRVAIVTNAGGAGVLAADACSDNGLQVAQLAGATRRRLGRLLPAGAVVTGPVDTTAAVGNDAFRTCLEEVAADDGVDAVLAVAMPTAMSDLRTAIAGAAVSKPIAAVLLDQAESVRMLTPGRPCYGFPEDAARALGHAARYRAWRDRPQGRVPELPGLRPAEARKLLAGFVARHPAGGWLPPSRRRSCSRFTRSRWSPRGPRAASRRRPGLRRTSAAGWCSRPRPMASCPRATPGRSSSTCAPRRR